MRVGAAHQSVKREGDSQMKMEPLDHSRALANRVPGTVQASTAAAMQESVQVEEVWCHTEAPPIGMDLSLSLFLLHHSGGLLDLNAAPPEEETFTTETTSSPANLPLGTNTNMIFTSNQQASKDAKGKQTSVCAVPVKQREGAQGARKAPKIQSRNRFSRESAKQTLVQVEHKQAVKEDSHQLSKKRKVLVDDHTVELEARQSRLGGETGKPRLKEDRKVLGRSVMARHRTDSSGCSKTATRHQ